MGRLIDADKLIQSWKDELWYKEHKDHKCSDVTWGTVYDAFIADAEHAPTAEERKTGRWIFQTITHGKRMWCSNCNSAFDLCCNQIKRYDEVTKKNHLWVYCPWCGAKMEEKDEQTD